MQPQLIVLLFICAALAAQGYYFGFFRPPKALAWLQKATFILMLFMMIPLVSLALWKQSGAVERLASKGVKPHPSILYPVGFATGPSKWVFKAKSSSEDIKSFYHTRDSLDGWELISSSDSMLIISNGEGKMSISMSMSMSQNSNSNTIIYMLLP